MMTTTTYSHDAEMNSVQQTVSESPNRVEVTIKLNDDVQANVMLSFATPELCALSAGAYIGEIVKTLHVSLYGRYGKLTDQEGK